MPRTPARSTPAARVPATLAAALAPALLIGPAAADDVQSTWTGAVDLSWTNPLNWSPSDFFPNDGAGGNTYVVRIDDAPGVDAVVELPSLVTISGLTIDGGDRLELLNGSDLRLAGDLTNDGELRFTSAGSVTELVVSAPAISLTGTGEIRLVDETRDRITGLSFGNRLVHGPGHVIRGGGLVGSNVIALENHGLIEATDGLELVVDGVSNDNLNAGTLRAVDGGRLTIAAGAFDGTGGRIEAAAGSRVSLASASITGGELATSGDGVVAVDAATASLSDLTNLGLLEAANGTNLDLLGTIVNDGTVRTAADGAVTEVRLASASVTLDGTGELVLGGDPDRDRVTGVSFGNLLVHGAGHVIRGGGRLGTNVIDIENLGLVLADDPAAELSVDPVATVTNLGTLRAASGSVLQLLGGTYLNAGGLVEAADGGTVVLAGAGIVGGDVATPGDGLVRIGTGSARLEDVHTLGTIELANGLDLTLAFGITNDGTIRTAADGATTEIRVDSEVLTIDGVGEIVLGGDAIRDRITGNSFGDLLVHGTDHVIRGGGLLGVNVIDIENLGLVVADDPDAELQVDPLATFTNLGTLRAAPGSELQLFGGTYLNDGGVIEAADGGTVVLAGAGIVGGDLVSPGAGLVRVGTGSARLEDVRTLGTIELANGLDLNLAGSITNDGTIRTAADGATTEVRVDASLVVLEGTGEILLGGDPTRDRITGTVFGQQLVHEVDHVIRGGGLLGLNVIDIDNRGTIVADDPAAPLGIDALNELVNPGTISVLEDCQLTILASGMTHDGLLDVRAGGAMERSGTIVQSGGVTAVDGTLTVTGGGVLDLQDGVLSGTGTVAGTVVNGGFVRPGSEFGALSIDGDLDMEPTGTLVIQINEGGADRLDVGGVASLGGSLQVGFEKNFQPVVGAEYEILTTADVVGQFAFANCPVGYVIEYGAESVTITIAEGVSVADLDCNGVVNFDDLLLLIPDWGPCPGGGVPCRADIDANGVVEFTDLLILLGEWD